MNNNLIQDAIIIQDDIFLKLFTSIQDQLNNFKDRPQVGLFI